ncbi:MAG TPA: hypothetical protein VIQ30_25200 [Pseudonocardia sp.]
MPKDPRAPLRAAGDEFKAIRTSLDAARNHLQPLMVAALKAGVPQREVVELSGYTRESVRTLARKNGIAPE